ncbi:MAG: type I-B CRISPR-associated endonuclease Cas1b [Bacteroidia bacterium]|nr:type I-B CRISPR-associated endonuclease Cas1b [Bacteroidia bacterium]MDW8158529.1 type I-B CRISPR-associated endonuclease Cas1b [Bacteroidia bacterium]
MANTYYIFQAGRIKREDQSLVLYHQNGEQKPTIIKRFPIEATETIYAFGALDFNTAALNFLGRKQVAVHFYDYYRNYTGSFMPREQLNAGAVVIAQARFYLDPKLRIWLARQFVTGAAKIMLRNLQYYHVRGKEELGEIIQAMNLLLQQVQEAQTIAELMGIEGNLKQYYYQGFNAILPPDFPFEGRTKNPPTNEINALISFANSMCYTICLREIHKTQLNPTISYLHEPGYRRFSLCLDVAEIFKPLITDRLIFQLVNTKQIQLKDFQKEAMRCVLNEEGCKTFVRAFENKLNTTIKHKALKRSVSYRTLIRLEAYKIIKHIMEIQPYKPLQAWW